MEWEYRILTGQNTLTENALNHLGREGWEMVGFTSVSVTQSETDRQEPIELVCVFKRARDYQRQRDRQQSLGPTH